MLLCFGSGLASNVARTRASRTLSPAEEWGALCVAAPSFELRLIAPTLRRHAGRFPKPRGEMALVAKPEPLRDLRQIKRGVAEQALCFIDAPLQDVLMRGKPRALLESAREVVRAEVRDLRQLGQT